MTQMTLDSITTNRATLPPRIVIYGDHGLGKTTFAASAPNAIVLRTEDGLAGLRVRTFPIARSYADLDRRDQLAAHAAARLPDVRARLARLDRAARLVAHRVPRGQGEHRGLRLWEGLQDGRRALAHAARRIHGAALRSG
jgi:hypothetical protein